MNYTVSSGTWNPSIPYLSSTVLHFKQKAYERAIQTYVPDTISSGDVRGVTDHYAIVSRHITFIALLRPVFIFARRLALMAIA